MSISRDRESRLQPQESSMKEIRIDLQAAVGARAELGPEMEDHVLDAFLARLEQRIDLRVDQAVDRIRTQQPSTHRTPNFGWVVGPSLLVSIPLLAIAGDVAQGLGLVAVLLTVFTINFLYFLYELFNPRS